MHSRESYLFSSNKTWVKKDTSDFDVAMGSFDGAEICELIGLYILSKLTDIPSFNSVGLYRDDGLGVTNGSGPQNEKLKKRFAQTFHNLWSKDYSGLKHKKNRFFGPPT